MDNVEKKIKIALSDLSKTNKLRLKAGLLVLCRTNLTTFQKICSKTVQEELQDLIELLLNKTPQQHEHIKQLILKHLECLDQRIALHPNHEWTSEHLKTNARLNSAVHINAIRNTIYYTELENRLKNNYFKITEESLSETELLKLMAAQLQFLDTIKQEDIHKFIQALELPGLDPNFSNEEGLSALQLACIQKNQLMVELLLAHDNIDVNKTNHNGWTALHFVARLGEAELLKLLLTQPGLKINAVNSDGWTALHWAAWHGHTHSVQMLLQHPEININCQDKSGSTALHWAARNGHADILNCLLFNQSQSILDPNIADLEGKTALHLAVEFQHLAACLCLLAHAAVNPNLMDFEGLTPLHLAVTKQNIDFINGLLSHKKIDKHMANNQGLTPTGLAKHLEFLEIYQILKNF
ncbi:MAG: ankyrin repeat domain-containing protein [Gammaproteobacteria bacterium]